MAKVSRLHLARSRAPLPDHTDPSGAGPSRPRRTRAHAVVRAGRTRGKRRPRSRHRSDDRGDRARRLAERGPGRGDREDFGAFAMRSVHEVADLQQAIVDVGPDCLLVDITTTGAAAAAEASGLPWARWIPFLAHASFDAAPSSSIDFLPYSLLPSGLDVVNEARAAVGLPPLTSPHAAGARGWKLT